MLRANLSTRPFYNERAVQIILGVIVLVVLAVTAFNVAQLVRLTASQRTLGAHAVESEREAARLRADAAAIRGQINEKELEVVANAAREANGIIDQKRPSVGVALSQAVGHKFYCLLWSEGLTRGISL